MAVDTASAGEITVVNDAAKRAILSAGSTSSAAVYEMVIAELTGRQLRAGTLVDVGCGTGRFFSMVRSMCSRYIGVDIVRYESFPAEAEFHAVNLDGPRPVDLPDETADVVLSIETIEHLENPRALMCELSRLAKPGALLLVTTPNQLTWLGLLTFVVVYNQFQKVPGLYPAHITHLLEADMIRIVRECGLRNARIVYSNEGRVPYTGLHWPGIFRGRRFSYNLMLVAIKP